MFWRSLRRRLLTPDVVETNLDRRGFYKKSELARERLETVGLTFLDGYAAVMEAATPDETVNRLQQLPGWLRAFAYEGAGMGAAVLDGLPLGRRDHVRRLLDTERGGEQRYLIYVGIGWAMARLPRIRWPRPDTLDQVLAPLVLDGYGFHQAYFHTRRYVHEHHVDKSVRWLAGGHAWFTTHAIDQGIGRALWFVAGTDPVRVANLIDTFPAARRGDLYAGAGLAATFAGGGDEAELRTLARRSGEHRGALAQACAFAAEARVRSGVVPAHTEVATRLFCGMTPQEAARLVVDRRPDRQLDGDLPAYEIWRRRLAAEFVSLGGVNT